jgi:TonB family protein
MAAELAAWLLGSGLALAVAIALVLALRPLWRQWLGSSSVLWLWVFLPAALVATSWPRPLVVEEFVIEPAGIATAAVVADSAAAAGSTALVNAKPAFNPVHAFLIAWLLGGLWMLIRLVQQQRGFLRRLGPLQRRADGSYLASSTRIGPAVVGALRPRIVLPADFEQRYDERQRALVLAHERCHLRRGDLQVNLLASALRCVFWFNPLVHLAAARLRVDQELACDAAVLRDHPDAGRDYATALLNTQLADLGLPVGCYWQSSQSLKWRIAMLKRPSPGAARLLAGAMLALVASSASAASLWLLKPVTTVAIPAAASIAMTTAPADELRITAPAPLERMTLRVDLPELLPATAVLAAPVATGMDTGFEEQAEPAADAPAETALARVSDHEAELTPPRVIAHVDARPPYRRSRTPKDGYVTVIAEIGADGRLVSASVPDEAVTPVYRTHALRAVEDWTFEPARRGDVAVAAMVALPVHFSPRREPTVFVSGIDPPGIHFTRPFPEPVKVPSAALVDF